MNEAVKAYEVFESQSIKGKIIISMTEENFTGKEKDLLGVTDKNPSNIQPKKLTLDSHLKFECHPGVSCFTACCGNINIIIVAINSDG